MPTTTGTFVWYNKGKKNLFGDVDLETSLDLRFLLTTSTYTPSATTHEFVSDITNEVSGNGYARVAVTSEGWTEPVAGTWRLDFDNPTWTASGGSIVAHYWVAHIYNASDAAAPLLAYGLLDVTPADVTTTDGNTLTANINASGFFEVT